ncbi:MAG: hypothetical protein R3B99_06790 [Polyangiales bacterium]
MLRAAAVFGEVFWTAGVETMVGESVGARVDEWLEDLATREIVTSRPSARFPSQRGGASDTRSFVTARTSC